ncbi:unnamed protein product [Miscanthus lutarioriparius]|uniref:Wall-associated receptor kinase galacturonan-binding domain-containing protein n=1 Tax=Miscanthus lutarioriparius TaxID=422564 RepID=A0A811PGY9_9POAL|nr:unnamed protein product [Miscanthus lutarioriparius]
MATISSSLASSLLPLLCLLLAAAANQQQEQPTPALPPITLAGCPDKCGNVSIPYPFGTKDGCFRPGFFVVCNDTFDPPRPFINSSLVLGDDDTRTQIIVEDLYYLTSKDHETTPNWSARPIELVSVSLADGKARLLGAFSYECRLNMTHHSVRRQSINFGLNDSPFVLSDADNVLMGIGSNVVAEQTTGPLCQSYLNPNVTYQGLRGSDHDRPCQRPPRQRVLRRAGLLPRQPAKRPLRQQGDHQEGHHVRGRQRRRPVSCSYAMIVEKTWYNFSSVDLDNDAFLRRNAAGVVPVVADFTIDLGGCPEAGEPTPKDFACISDNSECVDRPAGESTGHYCSCSVGYQGNPYIHGGCQVLFHGRRERRPFGRAPPPPRQHLGVRLQDRGLMMRRGGMAPEALEGHTDGDGGQHRRPHRQVRDDYPLAGPPGPHHPDRPAGLQHRHVFFQTLFLGGCSDLLNMMRGLFPELGTTAADCNEMSWLRAMAFIYFGNTNTPVEALLIRTNNMGNYYFKSKSDSMRHVVGKARWDSLYHQWLSENGNGQMILEPHGAAVREHLGEHRGGSVGWRGVGAAELPAQAHLRRPSQRGARRSRGER